MHDSLVKKFRLANDLPPHLRRLKAIFDARQGAVDPAHTVDELGRPLVTHHSISAAPRAFSLLSLQGLGLFLQCEICCQQKHPTSLFKFPRLHPFPIIAEADACGKVGCGGSADTKYSDSSAEHVGRALGREGYHPAGGLFDVSFCDVEFRMPLASCGGPTRTQTIAGERRRAV